MFQNTGDIVNLILAFSVSMVMVIASGWMLLGLYIFFKDAVKDFRYERERQNQRKKEPNKEG